MRALFGRWHGEGLGKGPLRVGTGCYLQSMFVHWAGLPLPVARFPPPSMTPWDRLDAQVAIAVGDVAGHGRGRNIDVDAIVAVAAGGIADQQRPDRPAVDQDPVAEVAGHDVA